MAFVIDIDGTLITNYHAIKGATEALDLMAEKGIPYILLTNNVSTSEQHKADDLNKMLNPKVPIRGEQIILNTTPLKKAMKW